MRRNVAAFVIFAISLFALLIWVILRTYPTEPFGRFYETPERLPSSISHLPFISPNKTKRLINQEYNAGTIGYEVDQGDSSYDGNGNRLIAEFTVVYDNLLNAPQAYSRGISGAIDVGCIAANNTSFKNDPELFRGFSLADQLYLPPFGRHQVVITVPGNCQFIGTSDGRYWWYAQ